MISWLAKVTFQLGTFGKSVFSELCMSLRDRAGPLSPGETGLSQGLSDGPVWKGENMSLRSTCVLQDSISVSTSERNHPTPVCPLLDFCSWKETMTQTHSTAGGNRNARVGEKKKKRKDVPQAEHI